MESNNSLTLECDHTKGRWMSGNARLPCLISSIKYMSEYPVSR